MVIECVRLGILIFIGIIDVYLCLLRIFCFENRQDRLTIIDVGVLVDRIVVCCTSSVSARLALLPHNDLTVV
jgi:hypothetical protein